MTIKRFGRLVMKIRMIVSILLLIACHQAHAAMYLTLPSGKHCVVDGAPTAEYPSVCTEAEFDAASAPPDPNNPKVYARMISGYVHTPIENDAAVSRSVSPLLFDQAMSALVSAIVPVRPGPPCYTVSSMTLDRATRTIDVRCDHATHAYHIEISDGTWLVTVLK